ncbi:gluconokinase [Rathayibacter rathayi]|uniref:Gluconokinase n=1 Tax=Rathayibacter rathayi TaxID=33887 RepID=A0ABD6W9R6_RATRA|nr:gluconokinase [Rathayibacter rathayi]AZZ48574.1 gluconokinase [Rathayibacter rathayi]MWV74888.1 AAA family ATPase [Rathayibacter rathayi NCPPB 2980 = VKM Ac-1601]PPF14701.1 gluconokinase [Rathayibacter rathayi]PPF24430.1 gluconokinase [Rathayibacter rathayi]PPF49931.1 gluconokinase [Rathayibacter rathayi]
MTALPTVPVRAVVVMGVSGSGKSTVASLLSARLGWEFLEGDDLHPQANVDKMHAGIPLTDEDRAPWLAEIARVLEQRIAAGASVVVTCSALRRRYRDVLRRNDLVFAHLAGSRDRIAARLASRVGHFMPTTLLDSQFEALEPLGDDEFHVTVDVGGAPEEEVAAILERLALAGA